MNVIKTSDFQQALSKLPKSIQRLFVKQEKRFLENYRDSRLHIKKVQSLQYAMSFRITRKYRVFFYFQNSETAIFFEIDHRKDIYRF